MVNVSLEDLNEYGLENINLTNCDKEAIHIPETIQPHGVLFVLEDDLQITKVSENSLELIGIQPQALLNRKLAEFVPQDCIETIYNCLEDNFNTINPFPISFCNTDQETKFFDGVIHYTVDHQLILELEPQDTSIQNDFFSFYSLVKNNFQTIHNCENLLELLQIVVDKIRDITNFDRVMVYRFDENGDGCVISEAKTPSVKSFLGLHYPASDIPQQARILYCINYLRMICDIDYQPVNLVGKKYEQPLDMRFSMLRSVSPIHIEYLKNMGVQASMSISILNEKKLWGLITCHHNTPKFVGYKTRSICEFIGQLISTEIIAKQEKENRKYQIHLQDIYNQLIESLTISSDFVTRLKDKSDLLLNLTGAESVVICHGTQIDSVGKTISIPEISALIEWLESRWQQSQFVTDSLSTDYPAAVSYQDIASGLLAIRISLVKNIYLLWFRPALNQTVNWAGNPTKSEKIEEDGTITISPRLSFEQWQETVTNKSQTWLPCEQNKALELRQAIIDIVIRHAEELASVNIELEKSNQELDSFAYIASHDLKEPLRGIHNYAHFLLEDYNELLPEEGIQKLNTLVVLTEKMERLIESLLRFSRLGKYDLQLKKINLNQLLPEVSKIFEIGSPWENCQIKIPTPLPMVKADRVLIEEVFTNLISNAFKYNDSEEKWVIISATESVEQPHKVIIKVEDNGIGIRSRHFESIFKIFKRLHSTNKYKGGTGAGLTIVKKIIDRHQGTIYLESELKAGTSFYFTLDKA